MVSDRKLFSANKSFTGIVKGMVLYVDRDNMRIKVYIPSFDGDMPVDAYGDNYKPTKVVMTNGESIDISDDTKEYTYSWTDSNGEVHNETFKSAEELARSKYTIKVFREKVKEREIKIEGPHIDYASMTGSSASGGGSYSGSGTTGNSNADTIFKTIVSWGIPIAGACGMLGNMKCENSNFDPALEVPDTSGRAIGICMFNTGGAGGAGYSRMKAVVGDRYNTLDGQLEFLKHELESSAYSSKLYAPLKNVSNDYQGVHEATRLFVDIYERCQGHEKLNNSGSYNELISKYNSYGGDSSKFDQINDNVKKRALWAFYFYDTFKNGSVSNGDVSNSSSDDSSSTKPPSTGSDNTVNNSASASSVSLFNTFATRDKNDPDDNETDDKDDIELEDSDESEEESEEDKEEAKKKELAEIEEKYYKYPWAKIAAMNFMDSDMEQVMGRMFALCGDESDGVVPALLPNEKDRVWLAFMGGNGGLPIYIGNDGKDLSIVGKDWITKVKEAYKPFVDYVIGGNGGGNGASTGGSVSMSNVDIKKEIMFTSSRKNTCEYLVIHTSVGPGATPEQICQSVKAQGLSVHGCIGPDYVFQSAEWDTYCSHCGSGNSKSIGLEQCESSLIKWNSGASKVANYPWDSDTAAKIKEYHDKVYQNAVMLFANLAKQYNIPKENVISHKEAAQKFGGSDHADPEALWDYFKEAFNDNKWTMDGFRNNVASAVKQLEQQSYSNNASGGNMGTGGSEQARKAVSYALSKIGCAYVYGAEGPNTFDCSGLMQWAYSQAGVSISRTTDTQKSDGSEVSIDNLAPGDLVICNNGKHVIMVTDPNAGEYVHASTTKGKVMVDTHYLKGSGRSTIVTCRRICP